MNVLTIIGAGLGTTAFLLVLAILIMIAWYDRRSPRP